MSALRRRQAWLLGFIDSKRGMFGRTWTPDPHGMNEAYDDGGNAAGEPEA